MMFLMHKAMVCASLLVARASSTRVDLDADDVPIQARFRQFKALFDKSYANAGAEAHAFDAFVANEALIREHNSKGLSYWLGHNEFSDMTFAEFKAAGYVGGLYANPQKRSPTKNYNYALLNQAVDTNSSFDWVAKGAVTPVKNQGNCGSCWAFSTTGALEGAFQISGNNLTSFSEEELVQCDNKEHHGGGNRGCSGGLELNAYVFISRNGLCTEDDYPYESGATNKTGSCRAHFPEPGCTPFVTLSGHVDVPNEKAMLAAINTQPVSVNIEADKPVFHLYKGGVLDNLKCGRRTDHAVLVVGYGTAMNDTDPNSTKPYYKVKNSWGSSWGEQGYLRMVRGKDMCGIATSASYPTGARRWVKPTPAPPTPPTPPTPPPAPTPCMGQPPSWCQADFNCSGSSALSAEVCDAWQQLYDALHEGEQANSSSWRYCSDSRADPCACNGGGAGHGAIIICNDDHIHSLSLQGNGIKGTLPESVAKLSGLQLLEISNNPGLHGTIPDSLASLTDLTKVSMGGNDEGAKTNGLHGTIPASLGSLSNLEALELFHNRLTGTIPPELAKLSQVSVFYLYNNLLHGRVPELPMFKRKYCGIGDAKGRDDGNYYCKPLPAGALHCNFEGPVHTRGNCSN